VPRAEHIAFVSPRFPEGPTVGGAETLLRALAERAAAAGRRVTFLTTCARDHFTWANAVPAGRRRIGAMDVEFFPVDETRDVDLFLRAQAAICAANGAVDARTESEWLEHNVRSRALQERLSADGASFDRIVMGPYLFGLIEAAARLHPSRTLLVPCLHDEPFARLPAFRRMFEAAGGALFNSEAERDLARRLHGAALRNARVVGMGLDPFPCDRGAFAAARGLRAPYLLYCGRREPMKGTPLLADYWAAFRARTGRDVKLVLTGSGLCPVPTEAQAHLLDAGFVSESEKHSAMAGALAFCHPSVYESLGIVLLEAWLAGTPALVHARG
jgi:glycosyltransferase involved in cell wall biosynthesis